VKVNKAFLIFTAIILMFCGTYIFACHSTHFNVVEIKIKGNNKITTDEIMGKAESSLGKNIFCLCLDKMEGKLRADIRLKDIRVKRRLPDCILIEVEEKLPVLWISVTTDLPDPANCGFFGLSIDQEIIPLDQKDLSHDLPIVGGIEMKNEDGKLSRIPELYQRWSNCKVKKALEFYKILATIDPSSVELLSEINLKDVSNLVLYLLPGIKVMMGSGDFERKWSRVRTILAQEERIAELVCLDLRFDDQVVLSRSSKRFSSRSGHHKNNPPNQGDDNL